MSGELITCGNNWIIIDKLDDVQDLEQIVADADPRDYSDYTTASGGSSQRYFTPAGWSPEYIPKLPKNWDIVKQTYEDAIQRRLVYHGLLPFEWHKLYITSGWTVTGNKGSYHTPHEHGRDYVSSVIYTEVPDKDPGAIYFVLHSDNYSPLYHPQRRLLHVHPEKGMIIIFPSWLIHGTLPQGEGKRTTVNFDLGGRYHE
jgi:hypothetical protein